MTIKVAFKHYPSAGKFQQISGRRWRYYVRYNGKDRRLPKFLWDKL